MEALVLAKDYEIIIEEVRKVLGKNNVDGSDNPMTFSKMIRPDLQIIFIDTDYMKIAEKIHNTNKRINIIFLAKNEKFKAQAFDLRASGYLIRPINEEMIKEEIAELRYPLIKKTEKLMRVQCFGNFDCFTIKGEQIKFARSKSKELFAYLVSKQGTSCTTREIAAILFEDKYGDNEQRYMQQLISSLKATLRENGCERVLVKSRNNLAVDPSLLDCDYYRFLNNDPVAKRVYSGNFMMQYEWADYIASYLDSKTL